MMSGMNRCGRDKYLPEVLYDSLPVVTQGKRETLRFSIIYRTTEGRFSNVQTLDEILD